MNHNEILSTLRKIELTGDEIFSLTRSIAYFFQKPNNNNVEALDLIIRLIDRRKEFEKTLRGVSTMIDAITREAGLYPYIVGKGGWREELVIELMRAPGLKDIIFHIEQALVFNKLSEGRSIILSAPTSFGKSLLIDALIAHKRPSTVVAVVPTIALLDEFRRRMEKGFSDYQVLTRSQQIRQSEKAIFIGTQERLLEREPIDGIDLFIIDEFYKLDLDRKDNRAFALNAILAKYGRSSKQIYLLGPSISDVPNIKQFRSDIELVKTHYSPVTADVIDRTDVGPSPSQLIKDLKALRKTNSLIYVRSPPAAAKLTDELIKSKLRRRSDFCSQLGKWLEENFHPEWILAQSVARGIGIHHGRIPRSIAQLMISLFNEGQLAAIVCTSSMIEGINTAAENVFIYDRMINTSKLDRFTFDNIKGRAGRMFKHNIGKIYLYNRPPDETQFDVRIPLFNSDELMMPELLLQVDDDNLTSVARRRKRAIVDASTLPPEILSRWAEFGIDELNTLAEYVHSEIERSGDRLLWKGIPKYGQIRAVFEFPWDILKFPKHDIRSGNQLALYATRLRLHKTMRAYLDSLVKNSGLAAQPEIDKCFNFLRGAEYTFPQILRATNDVIDAIIGEGVADYSVYASELQNLFLPGELRALDEYGVPFPLIRRLSRSLPVNDIEASRQLLAAPPRKLRAMMTPFEIQLLARGIG
jgi:hypothetical protein